VSEPSPPPGKPEPGDDAVGAVAVATLDAEAAARAAGAPLVVQLVATPLRSLAIGVVVGALGLALVLWFATVAQWVGAVLLLIGAIVAGFGAVAAMFPPGKVEIGPTSVVLPRRVSRPRPHAYPRTAVSAAYFLRSSTPWFRASPVLVIEAQGRAHVLPRDWFASEADQRRILDALVADAPGKA
jgi:hypothetical protein